MNDPTSLVCRLEAIPVGDRPRYRELVTEVRGAIRGRRELTEGFAYRIYPVTDLDCWIAMERRCCPFLTIEYADGELTMTGPAGVKALLDLEFPANSANP